MTFTPAQTKELSAPLNKAHVASRSQAGRNLSYIESWWAISEANRIFGFDGWQRETVDLIQLGEPRLIDGKYRVGYRAKVRITVAAGMGDFGDGNIIREGSGFGSGIDKDVDQAHESALKEAESDAMKRALMTFGNPFGLALYDKTQANVTTDRPAPRSAPTATVAGQAVPGLMTGTDLANQGRKSSAQAKRDGDGEKIKADISELDAAGIFDWRANFESYTAHVPIAWLDPIRDQLELREEELKGAASVAEGVGEMDEAFRASVGPGSPAPVARSNGVVAHA